MHEIGRGLSERGESSQAGGYLGRPPPSLSPVGGDLAILKTPAVADENWLRIDARRPDAPGRDWLRRLSRRSAEPRPYCPLAQSASQSAVAGLGRGYERSIAVLERSIRVVRRG